MHDVLPQAAAASRAAAIAGTPATRLDALAATIEFAPLGIAHFDREGNFLLANRMLCELLGYPREEVLRRNFLELTFPEDLASCLELNGRLAAGEIPSYRHEKRFVRADGSLVWACVTVSAARHADGRVDFYIGIAEDIDERRRAEQTRDAAEAQLARARDEAAAQEAQLRVIAAEQKAALEFAERATQLRDEMVAVVAHDLRNPLHTIALAAGTLESSSTLDGERRQRLHGIIRQTAVNMGRLLDDLLDVSRLESGTLAIAHEPVSPRALAQATHELFEARAAQDGIAWIMRIEPYLPDIDGDAGRLEQVLSNIVGNALKFTPRGGRVTLTCRSMPDGVEFLVGDTGPGIPPGNIDKLFDRFWKADPASRQGAGLGLAIARGIVEAHAGRIWAESEPGIGTTIRVVLPARR
jgi:PAS domain S-box-containing protein